MSRNRISVILPTYNERENIISLIDKIMEVLPERKEILVIDDNSPDGTANLVADYCKRNPIVRLIVRENERGLRTAIERGIKEAKGDIIVWMDSDGSMPPEKIPELIGEIKKGYDVAVGSRYVKGGKDRRTDSRKFILFFHKLLSRIIVSFTSFMLNKSFKDWTSGFIAIKSEIVKKIPLSGDYGEFFIEMMYRILEKKYKVIEVPYELFPRKYGKSKTSTDIWGFFVRGVKYLRCVFNLRRRVKI
ncbi:MAG: polyprenol monophosphomannose synthase [candidate division WOR-3 bacterium]